MIVNDIEVFKRGQIVPKRLGIVFGGKGQHLITFGCDCQYDYKRRLLIAPFNEPTFNIDRSFTGSQHKGTKRNHQIAITNLNLYRKPITTTYDSGIAIGGLK